MPQRLRNMWFPCKHAQTKAFSAAASASEPKTSEDMRHKLRGTRGLFINHKASWVLSRFQWVACWDVNPYHVITFQPGIFFSWMLEKMASASKCYNSRHTSMKTPACFASRGHMDCAVWKLSPCSQLEKGLIILSKCLTYLVLYSMYINMYIT